MSEYLKQLEHSELLSQLPFEHVFRNVSFDALLARLKLQRDLGNQLVPDKDGKPFLKLVIIVNEQWSERLATELEQTVLLWQLQSLPNVSLEIATDHSNLLPVRNWLSSVTDTSQCAIQTKASEYSALDLTDSKYVCFSRPGELHHPSLAYAVHTSSQSGNAAAVTWNYQLVDKTSGKTTVFQRVPRNEPLSLVGTRYAKNAVAFSAEHVNLESLEWRNTGARLSLLISLLAKQSERCTTVAEYLQLTEETAPYCMTQAEIEYVSNIAPSVWPSLEQVDDAAQIFVPHSKAALISVCIPFRDKPEITIKCLEGLAKQKTSGEIEILLVNNQSSASNLHLIETAASEILERNNAISRCELLHYNKPFNHSAQSNLGITQANGDVVVLLNNDADIVSENTLEHMSAWALEPGIGTVGCRIETTTGELICAGIKSRINCGNDFNSFVEESKELAFSRCLRECFANTFACAAISRRTIDQVGLLNAIEFPNGYNDVEYNLRVRRNKLKNMYLGHLRIIHSPGTSRGKCDELSEKIHLRSEFPEVFSNSLYQLEQDQAALNRANSYYNKQKNPPAKKVAKWLFET